MSASAPSPSRITIARTDPGDVGQRQVIVSVDTGDVDRLAYGESVSHAIAPGTHVLKANNTLMWKTIRFTAEPGEHVRFVVANRSSRFTLGFLALLGVAPLRMTIERLPGDDDRTVQA